MKNKIILICIVISSFCFSQNKSQIDSLLKLIQKSNDTTKLNYYNLLGKLYQSNNNEKVKEYGLKIIELASKTKNQKYIAVGYLKIGVYFHLENKFDSALCYYNKTILLSKASNNLIIEADAHQDLGILYSSIANDKKAIDELIIAQKIQHQLKNINKSADLLNNIAVIFIRQKNNNQAEKYILESIALMDTTIKKGLLGYQYANLGIIYEDRSQFQKAINYQRKALLEFSQINDLRGMAACYNNLFLSFVNQNKIDSALIFNNKLKINSKKQNDIGNEFFSNLNFSIVYQRFLNKPVYAKCYLDSMREFLPKLNKPEFYTVFYQESATYNLLYGNKDTGYFYMDKFLGLKDSLTSSENARITNELQTKYETEKKEAQLKQANADLNFQEQKNKQQKRIIYLGALAILLILVFLILAFVNFKKAKKANTIINNQNQILANQKKEVQLQKEIIEQKQDEIISSITYAQRIQSAVLTGHDVWNKISKAHFIVFQPRDIVSGDFYWAHVLPNGRAVFALADCTGHGVPGGFMSMLGNSFLNELVVENKLFKANEILNRLRDKVIAALFQKGQTQQKDGMDMVLCVWNKMENTLEFAGANNSLYIVREKQLIEYKGDKMPIGTYLEENKPFTSQPIALQTNDVIYLCTDGFADQFGGEKGKKFKYKQLENLLIEASTKEPEKQKEIFLDAFKDWKKDYEQTDDMSLIGIKVV